MNSNYQVSKTTWLVTGAAGFIGMHICLRLLSRGDNVVGIDNNMRQYFFGVPASVIGEIEKFTDYDNFTYYNTDIRNYSEIEDIFKKKKQALQENFIAALNKLNPDTNQCKELHTSLKTKQQDFFKQLTQDLTEDELKATIDGFRESCIADVAAADKIMGHGWLYRSVEVLIKAVLGLFASIGMVLASFVGQGFLLSAHRQQFANTFFTFDQTDESRALDHFKTEICNLSM
jgi:NAD(P)-dependent dehydrogenase (short-subunit alcohol dehydrogenase family)